MNRLRIMFFFLLATVSFFLYPLTSDQLREHYSLIIKAYDSDKKLWWTYVPGKHLVDNDTIFLCQYSFVYGNDEWNELSEMWQDVNKPEDVGCYKLDNNFVDVDNGIIRCSAQLTIQDEILELCYNFTLDKSFYFNTAFLVLNELLEECKFKNQETKLEKDIQNEYMFRYQDIEFDEEEITSYQQSEPPAKVIVYMRQIGVGILMRYLAVQTYLLNTWKTIKNKILA